MNEIGSLVLVTAATNEPLTVNEAKAQARIDLDFSDDDSYVADLVKAARDHAENFQWRALMTQTWRYYLDDWPEGDTILIPKPPLQSVTHVKYTDKDGTQSTFAAADYIVNTHTEPGKVVLGYTKSWPTDTLQPTDAIEIEFICGYGTAPASVPSTTLQGMLLLMAHWYENREPLVTGTIVSGIPMIVNDLLWQERCRW